MPLLIRRKFEKADPFRDATIIIVACEGNKREPDYFRFFDQLSARLKVVSIPSIDGKSSPDYVLENAQENVEKINKDNGDVSVWIAIDVDRWLDKGHIHQLVRDSKPKGWNIVISNPCFEVWLACHFPNSHDITLLENISRCQCWKQYLPIICPGGFNCDRHPILIEDAIQLAEASYKNTGFLPDAGCTQVFQLAKEIFALAQEEIKKYRD